MEKQQTSSIGGWRAWLFALALLLLATGLYFVIGGAVLLLRGGSWYFVIAGLFFVAAAVQIARARASGAWLYLLALAGTVAWALAEVGFDFWGLISRLLALVFIGALVAFTLPLLNRAEGRASASRSGIAMGAVLVVLGAALLIDGSITLLHIMNLPIVASTP